MKDFEKFYNFKYKDNWIKNKKNNIYLKNIDWELQLIWSEKINFVYNTTFEKYFCEDNEDNEDNWYGWCDIGYFRCRNNDVSRNTISHWPNTNKINNLDKNKIYYAIVNNDEKYVQNLMESCIKTNNKARCVGLRCGPLPCQASQELNLIKL